jgi:phosphatidylglycerophosphate synthase
MIGNTGPSTSSPLPSTGAGFRVGPWERATPNLLTAARVLLAIAFFAILTPWKYWKSPLARGEGPDVWLLSAAAVFIVGALTDALDGYLARRWNAVTVFGRIMDHFADKFRSCTCPASPSRRIG